MRRLIFATLLPCLLSLPVLAQTEAPSSSNPESRAAVIVDDERGVIRFIVEGKEVARFDAVGLHVRESVNYGGALMDYGASGFDMHIEEVGDAE